MTDKTAPPLGSGAIDFNALHDAAIKAKGDVTAAHVEAARMVDDAAPVAEPSPPDQAEKPTAKIAEKEA